MTNETGGLQKEPGSGGNSCRYCLIFSPNPDAALFDVCKEMHLAGKFCAGTIHWQKNGDSWQLKAEEFLILPPGVRRNVLLRKMDEINRGLMPP